MALVQRFVPHYNLVFYQKLLASSRYDWEFLYAEYPGPGESGLATEAPRMLPTRSIRNVPIGKALWQTGVTRWIRERRYHAVVFELGWQIVSNPLVMRAAHRIGAVAIPWTKGMAENGQPRSALREWAERSFVRHCDALLVYGQTSAEYFAKYDYPICRIFVAQNTVDVSGILRRMPEARISAIRIRARLGLNGRVVVGYLGRLVTQKRVDRIIEAFALARRAGLDAELVIAGDGPEFDALQKQANISSAAGTIHFCGRVPESEADGYFQMFDVFVSAFGAGLAILEAMAHAKVVLITPEVRPETELIRDAVTGFITDGYSVSALREGMRRAVESVREGSAVGQCAQDTVVSRARMENMVEAFDRAITYAMGTRATR